MEAKAMLKAVTDYMAAQKTAHLPGIACHDLDRGSLQPTRASAIPSR